MIFNLNSSSVGEYRQGQSIFVQGNLRTPLSFYVYTLHYIWIWQGNSNNTNNLIGIDVSTNDYSGETLEGEQVFLRIHKFIPESPSFNPEEWVWDDVTGENISCTLYSSNYYDQEIYTFTMPSNGVTIEDRS